MAPGFCASAAFCLILAAALASAGCLSSVFGPPPVRTTPAVTPAPTAESPTATVSPAEMALMPDDLPRDYSLKDRSIVAYDEVGQLPRELGWMQGYRVVYIHVNHERDDLTGIRQVIQVYPPESMNRVFAIEKDALLGQTNGTKVYEIPFPKTGDHSIAMRITEPGDYGEMTVYCLLFTKKNICETITMGGTATDYESLKSLAATAAGRIR